MIKIENVVLPSAEQWRAIVLGARNAMNSWNRSDSKFFEDTDFEPNDYPCGFKLGSNDYNLLRRLAAGGSTHAKYRRMITVYADVTAPLYWWKEADTYRMGVEKNSCSTMHKIAAKEFDRGDFSHEHIPFGSDAYSDSWDIKTSDMFFCVNEDDEIYWSSEDILDYTIMALNHYRKKYLETKDKKYWWQMIQLLPSSYNQKRTVMMNYEALANIYKSRRNHKLYEWAEHETPEEHKERNKDFTSGIWGFCDWIKSLPYSELITMEVRDND